MDIELNQNDVNIIEKKLEKMDLNPNSLSPLEIFTKISKEQKEIEDKEREQAWCNSFLKIYTEIQSNDRRGKVVEIFINQICESTNIKSYSLVGLQLLTSLHHSFKPFIFKGSLISTLPFVSII